jgi:hypothetical protein
MLVIALVLLMGCEKEKPRDRVEETPKAPTKYCYTETGSDRVTIDLHGKIYVAGATINFCATTIEECRREYDKFVKAAPGRNVTVCAPMPADRDR